MQLLLDTHTFIWFITGNPQLPPKIRHLIADIDGRIYNFGEPKMGYFSQMLSSREVRRRGDKAAEGCSPKQQDSVRRLAAPTSHSPKS